VSGVVVWITGRPSAGKSLFASRVRALFEAASVACCVLDGDEVRRAIVPPHGYDDASRDDFYLTLANLAALLASQGLVVIVPATAHLRLFRDRARALAPRFIEVWIDVSEEECARRDAKGLYAKVRAGEALSLPGADAVYEPPRAPDVVARGGEDREAAARVLSAVLS
jgi:adenylylsulfate kinase